MSIFKVAVTGGAGTGKSAVCRRFETLGVPVVNLDELSRTVVEPGQPAFNKIVDYFGSDVVTPEGGLDRPGLREAITRDPEAKSVLEGIVHPAVFSLMEENIRRLEQGGSGAVCVEVPLLFELGMESEFDITVVVAVSGETQLRRLMLRDGVGRESAMGLIGLQMPQSEKIKRADVVVYNDGSLEKTFETVDKIFRDKLEIKKV